MQPAKLLARLIYPKNVARREPRLLHEVPEPPAPRRAIGLLVSSAGDGCTGSRGVAAGGCVVLR